MLHWRQIGECPLECWWTTWILTKKPFVKRKTQSACVLYPHTVIVKQREIHVSSCEDYLKSYRSDQAFTKNCNGMSRGVLCMTLRWNGRVQNGLVKGLLGEKLRCQESKAKTMFVSFFQLQRHYSQRICSPHPNCKQWALCRSHGLPLMCTSEIVAEINFFLLHVNARLHIAMLVQ